jgi:predicted permease
MQDVRFGLRVLRKNYGFTAVVVLTLALGIGANATVFTVVNTVLFKGLPFEEPDRIVAITSNNRAENQERLGASYLNFLDWQAQSQSFEDLAAAAGTMRNISDPGLPMEFVISARVSANTFSLLGQKPLLGRDFLPHEDQGTAGVPVVILGHSLWQNRYGGDPNILGKSIRLNKADTTVIGVMPPGMKFPYNHELWVPLVAGNRASTLLRRAAHTLIVVGRLADGVSLAQAQAEMNLVAQRLEQEYPESNEGIGVLVEPYTERFSAGTIRLLFLAMLGAVGFVLLIACANVANLLLSRSLTREREVSIRAALGASRGRIVRQLLIESTLLGALGGAAGWLISMWGVRIFAAALPEWVPYWLDFSMDYRVLGYLAAICVGTSILVGLAPALRLSKVDLTGALKEGARGTGSGRSRFLSRFLVVSELALALVLLVGAGLMIRSFLKKYELGAGFENEKVLTMRVNFTGTNFLAPEPRLKVLERLEPELESVPGVEVAALASNLPLGWAFEWQFELDGQPPADPDQRPSVFGLEISPKYFQVLGIPLLHGRTFMPDEGREGKAAVIVNRSFADKHWPGENPIGKRLRLATTTTLEPGQEARSLLERGEQPWLTVVGEVADVKQGNPDRAEIDPLVYVPYRQTQQTRWMAILARTQGDAHSLAGPLRELVQNVNDQIPVTDVLTLPEHLARMRWDLRFFGSLFAIFAAIGLMVASIGIYAVMAYSVSQRTQEIGIRMAFGAQPNSILKLVVGQGLKLALIGVAIGLAAAFAVTRLMASFLVGVSATDPTTFALVAVLLAGIALLASFLPARRAARVDPMLALRTE